MAIAIAAASLAVLFNIFNLLYQTKPAAASLRTVAPSSRFHLGSTHMREFDGRQERGRGKPAMTKA
jgi:hypothetical protein